MTALRREVPDRVPVWELIVNEPTRSAWGAASLEEFVEQEDLDAITVFEDTPLRPCPAPEGTSGEETCVMDDWQIVWKMTDYGIPYPLAGPIRSADDLAAYDPPDPTADHRLATLRAAVERLRGERAIVFLTHDGFEFSHYLRGGMEHLMVDYVDRPRLAHELAEMVIDYKIRLMTKAIELGADVVVSGDDYAGRTGPLISPAHFEEFVLPYLKRSVQAAHDAGAPYIKHTDGNIWKLLDDLVDAGIDAIDPIEPIAGMDIGQVKERYGDRLALVGNVDCTELLPNGTPNQVAEAVKETIAKAALNGGYILASSNSIHPGVKPENYQAMVQAARQWGTYPLDDEMIRQYRNKNYMARFVDG